MMTLMNIVENIKELCIIVIGVTIAVSFSVSLVLDVYDMIKDGIVNLKEMLNH